MFFCVCVCCFFAFAPSLKLLTPSTQGVVNFHRFVYEKAGSEEPNRGSIDLRPFSSRLYCYYFFIFFYIHFVHPVKRVVFTLGEMPAAVEMAAIIVIIQWYDVSLHKYG